MKMKAVIIDDENQARATLNSFIQKYCNNLSIVGEADGVESGEKLIKKLLPELVFLDVQMKDGTGFDLLDKFQKITFKVIFVTAHDIFAIKAIRYSAFDYLLKPVRPTELIEACNKLKEKNFENQYNNQLSVLHNYRKKERTKIALPTTDGLRFLDINKIIRCESESCYTHIFTSDNEKITVTRTLKEYTELLPEKLFFRTHKSHLINLKLVDRFVNRDGGYILMENGDQVAIAKARKDSLLKLLSNI
jgi:two-component system LytT family response regulator